MRIVLDTNALLVSISKNSPYRPIFDALLQKKYLLIVSNEILTEYDEILSQKTNPFVSHNIIRTTYYLAQCGFKKCLLQMAVN